jgi:hypothetical protein
VQKIIIGSDEGFSITKGKTALAAAVDDYIRVGYDITSGTYSTPTMPAPPSVTISSSKTGIAAPAEQFQILLSSTPLKDNGGVDKVWEVVRRNDGVPINKGSPSS